MEKKILLVLAFITLFLVFFIPMRDTDFGWHLRCGERIVRERKLCSVNEFTTLLEGYRWYSPAHGYQILLFLTYRLSGFVGVSLLYAFSAALIFTLFLRILKGNLFLNLLIFIIWLWFSWGVMGLGLRSQVLSVYFLVLFLAIVEKGKEKPNYLLFLIPVMIAWSNFHPGFFLGNVLSMLLLGRYLLLYLRKTVKRPLLAKVFTIVTFSNLTTLINPYGFRIYQEVFRHTQVPLNTLIAEWVPPLPWQNFLIIATFLLVLTFLIVFKSYDPIRLGLLVFATLIALQARRNLPFFSIAVIYAISEEKLSNALSAKFTKIAVPEIMAAFFALILLVTIPNNVLASLSFGERQYCENALSVLPCKAVEFLNSQKPGNIFNAYEWGGYLIWKLPKFRIFVDGRMPSWDTTDESKLAKRWRGKSPYTVYIEAMHAVPEWQELMQNYNIEYLIIEVKYPLYELLEKDPAIYGYRQIYGDGVAVIYNRTPHHQP